MKVALLGHGVVGRGVDQILSSRDLGVEVTRILELPGRLDDGRMTSDYEDILGDGQIELVVECMGGLEPAHGYILSALAAGKSVVTSNKAVVAAYLDEFASQARFSRASLLIEATCGGGVPWIASIEKVRRIDRISSIGGIMNGTTNFIVDAMEREGAEFADVLARAQELGYAERDPSADIDGIDVRNKTAIAASVAFGCACRTDIPTSGIRNLTKADLDLLASRGLSLRLLGRAVQEGGRFAVSVEPVVLGHRALEANVPGNFNLLSLVGETVGELGFYGQGAGSLPTGNAMVQDILDFRDGRRLSYDLSADLAYDPGLLRGDYLLRSGLAPEGSEEWAPGVSLLRGLSAEEARATLDRALGADPTSFMAVLDARG